MTGYRMNPILALIRSSFFVPPVQLVLIWFSFTDLLPMLSLNLENQRTSGPGTGPGI